MRTPTQALADHLLKQPVEQWIRERRSQGKSYRRIALELRDATKQAIEVSDRTITMWAADPQPTEQPTAQAS
ncbi:MAG: hypothetical protein H0V07_00905 [Propionibacteriales bacterium]|nr:hypothetical protein [Propionibacteriales bacterium]